MSKGQMLKKPAAVMLASMLAVTTAACSSGTSGADGGKESKPETNKPKDPITLVIKHTTYDTFDQDLAPAIKKYQEKNPHVTVKVDMVKPNQGENIITANTALFASGEQIDILRVSPNVGAGEYAARGWVVPLDEYIKKTGVDMTKYYPSLQTRGVYGGKRYAMPWIHSQFMIFYNKDMFQKFGIPEPKVSWTYEDMLNAGRKLIENKVHAFEASLPNMLHIVGGAWGGTTFNPNGSQMTLDSQGALKGFDFFRDMVVKDGLSPGKVTQAKGLAGGPSFAKGTSGMSFTWLKMKQFDEAGLNYGVVPAPVGPGKQQGYGALDGIALSSTSKNKEEAWNLIKFLAYDNEGQLEQIKQKITIPAFPKEKEQIEAWEKTINKKDVTDAILYQVEKTNDEGVGMMNNMPGTEVAFEGFITWLGQNLFNDNFDVYTQVPAKVKEFNAQWNDLQKEAEKQMKK
ncbi:ABC transporter substrate-binding protein [Paenibacillus hodogayensis]|uniref:ABC transporter substrate-binding protein n=1 Tax=Paenibacillus hodogayensis TaxID=279208 RepID=A0ABV5VVU0_9BACL